MAANPCLEQRVHSRADHRTIESTMSASHRESLLAKNLLRQVEYVLEPQLATINVNPTTVEGGELQFLG